MKLKLDLSKAYGLVLEGGGAKGSYQIGAWKALREAGITIEGVAGASVGALNGAMVCMDDLETAEYLWENISYSKVMDVDDSVMESVRNRDLKALNMSLLVSEAKKVLKDKGFDITPLRELIGSAIDEEKIRTGPRELYITTYSLSDRQLLTVDAKELPPGEIGDMLMASAYLPVFKTEKLGGKRYLDGGGFDNVPVGALLERGYEDIIIIRIYGLGFDSEKVTQIPEGTQVYHIAPRQNLGGILEFDKKLAAKNMRLGYFDAHRLLYGLEGRWYYLDADLSEEDCFGQLAGRWERLEPLLPAEFSEESKNREEDGLRYFTEYLFPALARQWTMKEDWNYRDLYRGILEYAARSRRISRFKIYTPQELLEKIYLHDI